MNIELQNSHEREASQGESCLWDIVNVSNVCSQGYLIFVCRYTIAVIPSFGGNWDLSSYFLFDSHSRNDRGITTCKTGFSVLRRFLIPKVRFKNILKWHMK